MHWSRRAIYQAAGSIGADHQDQCPQKEDAVLERQPLRTIDVTREQSDALNLEADGDYGAKSP